VKELEAALRVVNVQIENQPDHPIEDDSADLAEPGLVPFDIPTIESTRADDDVDLVA